MNTVLKPGLWGMSTSIDLYNCNLEKMNDPNFIKTTVIELCELIEMVRYGDCQVVFFGSGNKAGYSMFQLIETSNLSAHFANDVEAIYFDIFSCKAYEPEVVADFLKEKFNSNEAEYHTTDRRL